MSAETLEFRAELKQLLHLITHSLYSDREIFLRELISNAADAVNKIRFDSLSNEDKLEGNKDWKIVIAADKDAKTLRISDNGCGMSRDEVVENLGTIAKSGTKAFLEALKAKQSTDIPGLIGQFGVGFYSAFMVADKVTVLTRPPGGPNQGVKWESDGQGTYAIEPAEKAERGTDVILHLKDDAKDFLESWKLRTVVKKFSDFVEHPVILLDKEEKDGETTIKEDILNNRKAIWLRAPREVTSEEYTEFYKTITHDFGEPAKTLHFSVEGATEFRALLFIPAKKPLGFEFDRDRHGLRLYVQRVLIMDQCEEVLPHYLRFVRGVIDSADLPLNVSREVLQQNPHLDTIRKNVVRNILSGLEGLKNVNYEKYLEFHRSFSTVLKEGLARDWENKDKLADLMLYASDKTEAGKSTTLGEYVEKMATGQEKIFTLTGESAEVLRKSPYLESYRTKGFDVLFMTDPVDEFVLEYLTEYKGKALQAIDRGDAASGEEVPAEVKEKFAGLLAALKTHLPEVSDVRLTKRLTESAACLVAEAGGVTAHLERILRRAGENVDNNKRVLELNPENAAVAALRELHAASPEDARIATFARLLFEQAVVAEGSRITNQPNTPNTVNELIVTAATKA